MIAATSASRTSAARSTAARAAAASVVHGETLATNSASCWVHHAEESISADRQEHESLVVEAADTAGPGDLAVGVAPGHGRARRHLGEPADLALDALLAEDGAPGDAVEGDQAKWRTSAQRGKGVAARGIGGLEHRPGIALHDPDEGALRNLGDAGQRPF